MMRCMNGRFLANALQKQTVRIRPPQLGPSAKILGDSLLESNGALEVVMCLIHICF